MLDGVRPQPMSPATFSALSEHLVEVEEKGIPFDVPLLEHSEALFTTATSRQEVLEFISTANRVIATVQQDPSSLCPLLEKVLSLVHFNDIKDAIPLGLVEQALKARINSVQALSLAYLRKASEVPSGAAMIGANSSLVKQLISLWMSTERTDIADKALDAMCALLTVDNPETRTTMQENGVAGEATGQDLLWRRLFRDVDVFNLVLGWTSSQLRSLQSTRPNGQYYDSWAWSAKQSSVAQGRLFNFISRTAALRWELLSQVPIQNSTSTTESLYPNSLLHYAALDMIDENDELMIPIRINFFISLLNIGRFLQSESSPHISPALQFLIDHGKHAETLSFYLERGHDSLTLMLLSGAHVRYLATYLERYPNHFLNSDLEEELCARLYARLNISGNQWASGRAPVDDLAVLAHMPGIAIEHHTDATNAFLCLPTSPVNASVLNTLAKIFHGPNDDTDPQSLNSGSNGDHARTLYHTYIASHPEFWTNIAGAINILATPDTALAAISLLRSLLTSRWSPCSALPVIIQSGQQAIESLITPIQSQGRDAEASRIAWRIASAKQDLIVEMLALMDRGADRDRVDQGLWKHTYHELRKGTCRQSLAPPPTVDAVNR